ncbi:MAG: hypothetical protein NTY19_20020 [Planctomycetota bacterium]|nr:hypothetical protein [Planctomycetota bacterium]
MVEYLHAEDTQRRRAQFLQGVLLTFLILGQLTPARQHRVLEDLHQLAVCDGKDVVEKIALAISLLKHDG